jgi:hypothetical protein
MKKNFDDPNTKKATALYSEEREEEKSFIPLLINSSS